MIFIKTRIYFVRHAETVWNVKKKYQGLTDIELSDIGKKQSILLAERFKKSIKIDKIYTSPLKRAVQTAEVISNNIGIGINLEDCFKEISFGEWEGKTAKYLEEKYKKQYTDFIKNPYENNFPGDISMRYVEERVANGINRIIKNDRGKNILIVSHGGLLKVLFLYIMDIKREYYRNIWIDNTGISMIQINELNKPILLKFNDTAHIELNKM